MGRMTNDCMHGTRNVGYGGPHNRDKGNLIGNDIGGSVKNTPSKEEYEPKEEAEREMNHLTECTCGAFMWSVQEKRVKILNPCLKED